jgi:DNA polymerase I-like protein with 3'-5' exonuclease and polymerase domains
VGPDEAGRYCKSKYKASYYQWDKNGGFCKQYGGQRAKTDATFHRDGAFDLLDSRFSRLAKLNAATVAFAEKHGYVETLPDKTVDPRRGYPLLCTRTEWGKVLPTVPLNYKVQGTAMWCTRKAMVRCEEQLAAWRKEGFDAYIVMQVHDEIDFDFPVGGAANLWRAKRLQQLMAQSGEDVGIPLRVGVSYHPRNWAEEVKLEGLS